MSEQPYRETTQPLLRQDQIEDMKEEKRAMESMLHAPPHIGQQIQNRGELHRQLRSLDRQLENQTPKPYEGTEMDAALKRAKELEDKFTEGMPSGREMRRAPAGAVDKHRRWEARNKRDILEWKNIQRRLAASDHENLQFSRDIANVERFRKIEGGAEELNLHNSIVQGKTIDIPRNVEIRNVMEDDEREKLEAEIASLKQELSAKKGK